MNKFRILIDRIAQYLPAGEWISLHNKEPQAFAQTVASLQFKATDCAAHENYDGARISFRLEHGRVHVQGVWPNTGVLRYTPFNPKGCSFNPNRSAMDIAKGLRKWTIEYLALYAEQNAKLKEDEHAHEELKAQAVILANELAGGISTNGTIALAYPGVSRVTMVVNTGGRTVNVVLENVPFHFAKHLAKQIASNKAIQNA